LGALDYRAIAQRYPIVSLEQVVVMDLEGHNRARRFITLIDELYEAKCCLLLTVASASAASAGETHHDGDSMTPKDLFQVSQQGGASSTSMSISNGDLVDNEELDNEEKEDDPETVLGIDVATQGGTAVGALASVRELAFAFQRASSRIVEMCSQSWWEKQLAQRQQRQL
jgi:predicted ATPase